MISLDKLMNLSEAATGFKGGSTVDELPGMSLSEATAGLPIVILESQIELHESVMAQNEALVECVITGLETGTKADLVGLTEGAFDSIIKKIQDFFARLRKWVSSIIEKLTIQINKVRMNGEQMLAKYKNHPNLNQGFTDFTYTGYKFDKKDPFVDTTSIVPGELIRKIVPNMQSPKDFQSRTDNEEMTKALEAVKEVSAADRKLAFAKALVNGIELTDGEHLKNDLNKALYGDKVEMKYGADFNLESVKSDLKGEDLDKIRSAYKALKTAIEKDESEVRRAADEYKTKNAHKEQAKDPAAHVATINSYYTAYLSIYQDCTAVIGTIKDSHVNYTNARVKQAKNIFAKMLTHKKKDNNDASGIDEIDLLDFEL